MYLKRIKIWNFRKISTSNGSQEIEVDNAGIDLELNNKMNVIVGENNSGKTTIIDAIRFLLGTHSQEYIRLNELDFHFDGTERRKDLRIEAVFSGFTDTEAAGFIEWLSYSDDKDYELNVWLHAFLQDNRVIYNVRAGADEVGIHLDGEAKYLLRTTYLKPLRDAEAELSPGYRSRLAHVLINDPIFKKEYDEEDMPLKHALEKYISKANELIEDYFSSDILNENSDYQIKDNTQGGGLIKKRIESYLNEFFHTEDIQHPEFKISGSELKSILRKLSLTLEENKSGLGALNQLFIAVELLLLQGGNYKGLRLALIEEIEAHLHPQAQLRLISALQDKQQEFNSQFILTTHSTTLASKINLDNLILCHNGKTFSLAKGHTGLRNDDYEFLERFLDATKSNLFFAKGVILVEGDSENILIPAIAEIIGRPLHKYGVSIVNVGSTAFLRYAKIFQRQNNSTLPIKVSIITDLDIEQVLTGEDYIENKTIRGKDEAIFHPNIEDKSIKLKDQYDSEDGNIKLFHSPLWTMEYDISLGELVEYVNSATYIAQLTKSRISNQVFEGLSEDELEKRIVKSEEKYNEWIEAKYDNKRIAFEIYKRLKNGSASKAVTAQWLVRLLKEDETEVLTILKDDKQVKYLLDAIYHVTKPRD